MSDPRCPECGWCLTVRSIKDSEPETICTRCCWSSIAERLRAKVAELEAERKRMQLNSRRMRLRFIPGYYVFKKSEKGFIFLPRCDRCYRVKSETCCREE